MLSTSLSALLQLLVLLRLLFHQRTSGTALRVCVFVAECHLMFPKKRENEKAWLLLFDDDTYYHHHLYYYLRYFPKRE